MREPSETRRQLLHIAAGGLALLLRWLTWPQAAALASVALAFNTLVLPRLDDRLLRPADRGSIIRSGIAMYPASILVLILLLRERLDIVAIAWVILAAGDGLATLVGVHLPTRPLPWNRAKSMGGLAAFLVAGAIAALGIARWTAPGLAVAPPPWYLLAAPIAAAAIAAFVETVPIRLDDNLSVPFSAAIVTWSLALCRADAFAASATVITAHAAFATLVNVAFAVAGWRARTVTGAGAIAGACIGILVWLATGPAGWMMLFLTFAAAAVSTRLGHQRKMRLGIAEERGGRRGSGNAIANTGLAAWAAVISLGLPEPTLARIAMVAALTTAASDTVASEIGKAWGRTTWLVTTWRRVAPGTSGAISLEGTAANVVAAIALAAAGVGLGLIPGQAAPFVVLAAVVASLIEGVLGATLEASGILNNDALNFLNTAAGAALAMALWLVR